MTNLYAGRVSEPWSIAGAGDDLGDVCVLDGKPDPVTGRRWVQVAADLWSCERGECGGTLRGSGPHR